MVEEEYQAVRQGAGLIEWPMWGLLEIGGTDRAAFLHGLLTNDIKRLGPGSGCQAALVTASAKLLADLLVLADQEANWLLVPCARAETVLKTLDHYLITEAVTLGDRTQAFALLTLQGPASLAVLRQVFGMTRTLHRALDHTMAALAHVPVRVISHSLTGEPGAILVVPTEQAAWVREQILQRAHPQGVRSIGWDTLNVLRIEAGIPWYGVDMDESNLLPETGLERSAVSNTKGCYVGQEVIARLQTYGSASRKLMGLVLDGTEAPVSGDAITKEGEALGAITSACVSPALGRPIAMGYVKRPFYEAGTAVAVRRGDRVLPATLVARPFTPARTSSTPGGG